MRHYAPEFIRNVAVVSHGGAGKTTLIEAMMFTAGCTTRMGRVEDGNTVSDFDPDESRRHMSISSAVAPLEWRDTKINLIDTPGYSDFVGEVQSALRVADSALIVVDASSPVEVGTESVWRMASERGIARMIYVNKLSRENANFESTIAALRARFGKSVVAVQFPVGVEKDFNGVVDLLREQSHTLAGSGSATEIVGDVPDDLTDVVDDYRKQLIEVIAEQDEELMVRYLDDDEIALDELLPVLRKAVLKGNITPIFCGSATVNIGTHLLLDDIVEMAPWAAEDHDIAGSPLSALVFKTIADPHVGRVSIFRVYNGQFSSNSHVANTSQEQGERIGQVFYMRGKEHVAADFIGAGDIGAVAKLSNTFTGDTLAADGTTDVLPGISFPHPSFSVAVRPHSKADLDKLGQSLHRLVEEDPSLQLSRDSATGESILSGMGESHVQIALDRMSRRFGVSVDTGLPRVAYRETVGGKVTAEYKHKKQTGGAGQYGHVFLEIEPLPDEDFQFSERVVGGSVPRNFFPAVEKGVREALESGPLAGYPVVNVRVTLCDGSYHDVDSSEMAFKIAAKEAFKKGVLDARPTLLEPVVTLQVTVPDQFAGDVMSDLNTRRGHVNGMNPEDGATTIEASVPAAEVQRYATDLRSITQGRGTFTTEFSHYQQVPPNVALAIQAANQEAAA